MKQKHRFWYGIFTLCLCVLLPLSGFTVFAAEEPSVELNLSVPQEHTVSVQVAGGGLSFELNGQTYTGSAQVNITRGSDVTFVFHPGRGQEILRVLCNGTDVTGDLSDGRYTIHNLTHPVSLTVTVNGDATPPAGPDGTAPETGDFNGLNVAFLGAALSFGGLLLCLCLRKRAHGKRRGSLL